jgi:hypothetical protein
LFIVFTTFVDLVESLLFSFQSLSRPVQSRPRQRMPLSD